MRKSSPYFYGRLIIENQMFLNRPTLSNVATNLKLTRIRLLFLRLEMHTKVGAQLVFLNFKMQKIRFKIKTKVSLITKKQQGKRW